MIFKNSRYRHWFTAYCLLAPAMLIWLFWFGIPALKSFAYSFYEYNYTSFNARAVFAGFANYSRLFRDAGFIKALKNSFLVVLVAVPVQTLISLSMALLVDRKIRGKGIFRTLFYMPYVLSTVAVATVFIYLFAQDGLMTKFFTLFGFPGSAWSTSVNLAMPLIIIMFIWQSVGFYMLMFLSGLQNIPQEIMESAQVDGADARQAFFFIKLPLLQPTTFLVVTYGIINAFLVFDQIATVAGTGVIGSPAGALTTMVTFYYQNAYKFGDVGYGSAAVCVLFLVILLITLVQSRFNDRYHEF